MAKRLISGFVVILSVSAIALLVYFLTRPKPVEVAVWEVKPTDINETVTGVATGFIEPARRLSLQPEILARVKEVRARRGDRVRMGQVLVVLDDTDFKDQLLAMDAALPLFEARLKQAKAHAAQIRQDFERAQKLSSAGTLTVQQFETAKMALDLGTAESDAAESALHQARVNKDIVFSSLRKTRVKAPFDGLLLECDLVVGQLWGEVTSASLTGNSLAASAGRTDGAGMTTGAAALLPSGTAFTASPGRLEIADDSRMFVVLDVDENDYGKLKIGQTAALTLESLAKKKMAGSLVEIFPFISRALDQNRTSRVKIRIDRGFDAGVVPGMSVNVEILISSRPSVLAVPTATILVRPRGAFVYRLAEGRLMETAVGTGVSNWEWTEITSGLAAGDRVAGPPEKTRLQDGLRVVEKDREF